MAIQVTWSHEEHWPEEDMWEADVLTMSTDAPYNPTVLRDLRDAVVTMITERDDHLAELTAAELLDDEEYAGEDEGGDDE